MVNEYDKRNVYIIISPLEEGVWWEVLVEKDNESEDET